MRKNNQTIIKLPNQWFEKKKKIIVLMIMTQPVKNHTMYLEIQTSKKKS